MTMPDKEATADGHALDQIREAVAALCSDYPGEYWREKDRERAYPTEFVEALTRSGFLGALIPEEYGGSGLGITEAGAILEEVQRAGCNGGACHAQMYTMGTILRHGSPRAKSPIGCPRSLRASCACRPSASPSRPAAPIR